MKRHRAKKWVLQNLGFTLIEFLIAMTVLFLGLGMGIAALNYLNQSNETSYQEVVALQDAHRVIEQMRQQSNVGTFPGNVTTTFPDAQNVNGFNNLNSEQVSVNYVNTGTDPLDVTVTVTWVNKSTTVGETVNNRTMTTQLTTLITQR